MGLGDSNPKESGKRSGFNYELRHLQLLGIINNAISGLAPPVALATETTLQAVLTAVDSMRDYEVRLVVDSDTPPVTWLEVRYWDAQTGALAPPIYYPPGSTTPGTPVGSLSYINPNTFLASILAELVALNTTDFATETTLSAVQALLTGATRNHNTVIATGAGSVPAGSIRGSVLNTGSAAGTWNGVSLPAGLGVPWGSTDPNDTYNTIAYDATGTTFVIEYTT